MLESLSASVDPDDGLEIKRPEKFSDFIDLLYPPPGNKKGKFNIRTLRSVHLSMYESFVAYDSVMALLTSTLRRAGIFELADKEETRGQLIPIIKAITTSNEITQDTNWQDQCNKAKQSFSVKASEKYSGGLDVSFVGTLGARPGISRLGSAYSDSISLYTTGDFETQDFQNYQTELGLRLLELIKKVRNYMFEGKGAESTDSDIVVPFEGTVLDFAQFKGEYLAMFPALSPEEVDDIFVRTKLVESGEFSKAYSLAVRSSRGAMFKNREDDEISEVGKWCNTNVSFGIMIHFPKEVLSYITQSTPFSKSNLTAWLHEWSSVAFSVPGRKKGGGRSVNSISHVISSPSKLNGVVEKREGMGLVGEVDIRDDDGLYFARSGNPSYLPKSRVMEKNIKAHELYKEQLFDFCMSNNIPCSESYVFDPRYGAMLTPEVFSGVKEILEEGEKTFGTVLGYDTAYGTILHLDKNGRYQTTRLNGSRKPDALTMANILGYDFAGEGGSGYNMTASQAFARFSHSDLEQQLEEEKALSAKEMEASYGSNGVVGSVIYALAKAYTVLAGNGHVPDPNTILTEVYGDLKEGEEEQQKALSLLNTNGFRASEVDHDNMVFSSPDLAKMPVLIVRLFSAALFDSSGNPSIGSGLYYYTAESVGGADPQLVISEARASDKFFDTESPFESFRAMSNYLGGRLIIRICQELLKVEEDILLGPMSGVTSSEIRTDGDGVEIDTSIKPLTFARLTSTVMPFCIVVAKHLDRVDEYWGKADEHIQRKQEANSVEASDLILPGVKDGSAVFPHQLSALGELRTDPEFAILDIDPGGGKTLTTIYNIMDMLGRGIDVKPLVLCPDRLVSNWCDDINKVTKGTWNCIPLATSASDMDETDLIAYLKDLPPNSITIAGLKWTTSGVKNSLNLGGFKSPIALRSDILRSVGFNYVAVDESQNLKNFTAQSFSATHEAGKLITTFPSVKWVRLATGTFIHNTLVDAVGQTALFSSGIFGDSRYFDFGGGDNRKDASKVRSKLGQFVSVVTRRRKEWAFMLPNPIDTLIAIEAFEPAPGKEGVGRIIHKSVYESLLGAAVAKIKTGKTDASDVLENEDGDEISDQSEIEDMANADEADEDNGQEININAAKTYLQRVEAILTDPWGDPDFVAAATEAELTPQDYTPLKLQTVHERLDVHYTPAVQSELKSEGKSPKNGQVLKWEPNMDLRELDRVEHNGAEYMVRRVQTDTYKRQDLEKSSTPPDQAPDMFKPEKKGKVLIFCRFTREVDAIFESLPAAYKKKAVKFHSKVENASGNLDAFVNDPDMEILVANEQGIKEGHNMQIASRIIRVASPWTPGDYEQASARIFRPDVAAALNAEDGKAGDMDRELIYIDWICTQNTLEVPKIARLMAKTVEKVQFDEDGNEHYDRITLPPSNDADSDFSSLPPITMNYEMLLEENNTAHFMRDPVTGANADRDYFGAKATLNDLQQQEFSQMRANSVSKLIPVETTKPLPNFRKLEVVPMASNQHLKVEGLDLKRGSDKVAESSAQFKDNTKALQQSLHLKPVITPFGKGVIVGMTMRSKDPKYPVSTFKVRISDKGQMAGELFSISPLHLHFVEDLSREVYDKEYKTSKPFSTKAEETKHSAAEAKKKAKDDKANKKKASGGKSKTRASVTSASASNATKRRENKRKNKPINDGVIRSVDKVGEVKDGNLKRNASKPEVELEVTMFNGWLTVIANLEDPDVESFDEEFGFRELAPFMYIELQRLQHIDRLDAWMMQNKKKFHYAKSTEQMLDLVFEEAFRTDNKNMFDFKLAARTLVDLPRFFVSNQRLLKDKKAVRMFPCIMEDRVRLMVDIKTNPVFRSQLNQKIPGIPGNAGKWTRQEGASIYFASSKGDLNKVIKQIAKVYTIANAQDVSDQLTAIKPYRGKVASAI